MDHRDDEGDGAGDGDDGDVEASSHAKEERVMMAVISPLSEAPEQQDLTPFREDREFRRHLGLR